MSSSTEVVRVCVEPWGTTSGTPLTLRLAIGCSRSTVTLKSSVRALMWLVAVTCRRRHVIRRMAQYLSSYLSIHLSIYHPFICIYHSSSLCMYVYLYQSTHHLSILYPSIYIYLHLSISIYIYLSIYVSLETDIHPSIHPSYIHLNPSISL